MAPLGAAQDAGERLDECAGRVVDPIRERDAVGGRDFVREAAGDDRRRGKPLARRLVPRPAAVALAAGQMVDERDARPVGAQRDDFVPEHRPRGSTTDLLHVRAAEPAGEHGHRLAGGRRHVGKPGPSLFVEHDRAHVRNRRALR